MSEYKEKLICDGSLLFQSNHSSDAIAKEIERQIEKFCIENDETCAYRIDWTVVYGKKFGYE